MFKIKNMTKVRQIIFLFAIFSVVASCGKNHRYTKRLDGYWRLTKMVKNGENIDLAKLKIELEITLSYPNTGTSFANYLETKTNDDNSVTENNLDVEIVVSNKGKTMTFDYEYGTLDEFIEVYDVVDMSRNKLELKFLSEEYYYTFEKLKL